MLLPCRVHQDQLVLMASVVSKATQENLANKEQLAVRDLRVPPGHEAKLAQQGLWYVCMYVLYVTCYTNCSSRGIPLVDHIIPVAINYYVLDNNVGFTNRLKNTTIIAQHSLARPVNGLISCCSFIQGQPGNPGADGNPGSAGEPGAPGGQGPRGPQGTKVC